MAHGSPRVGCHHQSRWCQQWVSSPTMMPRLGAGLHWCWSSKQSHISPFDKRCLTRAHGNQTGTHSLPRDATAQLRSAQCIGTRSHSGSHTHMLTHTPSLSPSLSHSLLPPLSMLMLLLELLLNYFLPFSLWVSGGIHSSALCLLLRAPWRRQRWEHKTPSAL